MFIFSYLKLLKKTENLKIIGSRPTCIIIIIFVIALINHLFSIIKTFGLYGDSNPRPLAFGQVIYRLSYRVLHFLQGINAY